MKAPRFNKSILLLLTAKRQTFIISVVIVMLTGCNIPKRMNHDIGTKYGGSVPAPVKRKSDYISITSTLPSMADNLVVSEKKTSTVLPLLFYWQLDRKYMCTLNPQIPVNNFITTVTSYANKGLKQKLNGQRIELSLDKVPNKFEFYDKERMVWIIYGISWETIIYTPENTDMVVSYKIFGAGNVESKSGTITVTDTDKSLALGKRFQSVEKKTWAYLDQYTTNITSMSKSVVDKLIVELN